MNAIILAAGRGTRLGLGTPKCLARVANRCLIEHQLDALREAGVARVMVVTGFEAMSVDAVCAGRAVTLENESFASTNSLYSLWLARRALRGPFVLINGDVFADPSIYRDVAQASGSVLAYDSTSGEDPEHMKVVLGGRHPSRPARVRRIGKDLGARAVSGESLGLMKFDAGGADAMGSALDELVAAGEVSGWAPQALDEILDESPMHALDVAPRAWVEIDFPDDLRRARAEVAPRLETPLEAFAS